MALSHRFAIGPDIGQDHHLAAGAEGPDFGLLKRAESGAKGDLLIVVEDLVRKHQNRVTAERGTQFRGEGRRWRGSAITPSTSPAKRSWRAVIRIFPPKVRSFIRRRGRPSLPPIAPNNHHQAR